MTGPTYWNYSEYGCLSQRPSAPCPPPVFHQRLPRPPGPDKSVEKRLGIHPPGIGGVPWLRSENFGSEMSWRRVGDELGEEGEARPLTKGEQPACSKWVNAPPPTSPAHAQKEKNWGRAIPAHPISIAEGGMRAGNQKDHPEFRTPISNRMDRIAFRLIPL